MENNETDVMTLARLGRQAGYVKPEHIVQHLRKIITRNAAYVARPYRQAHPSAYDAMLREDNQALAQAIVLLNSLTEGGN